MSTPASSGRYWLTATLDSPVTLAAGHYGLVYPDDPGSCWISVDATGYDGGSTWYGVGADLGYSAAFRLYGPGGTALATAECDTDCSAATCGDGQVNALADEACDDGGESATCDADCTAVVCGDGVVNLTAGEACDDGGSDDGDGCSASCQVEAGWTCVAGVACVPTCGDGLVRGDEQCDDHDQDSGDGCSAACTRRTRTWPSSS